MLSVVNADGSTESGSLLDEIVREGARRILAAALEAEANQYMAELVTETDEAGRRLVVRTGHHRPRTVTTAAGPVEVTAPRVNDKRVDAATGERLRESAESWADLPRDCRRRGMRDPELVVGDGAKFPKAVAKITEDREELLAFYDFPVEHWIHLRTMNPIESTFSTVRLRTKVTRGAGSPAAAFAMVFKLVESAQARWRAVAGAHLVALVRAGARFGNGVLVERQKQAA
ncbi:transposase [Streptomyces sp. NPDC006197]|uniref:transposase n=1 Tax=Streptomyces sp. NPDC006197 TaxID=3156685 RepID=UPI0033BE081C